MAINRIILWLGYSFIVAAAMMIVTTLAGFLLGELYQAGTFAGTSLAVGVLGLILVFSTRLMPAKESFTEALAFLIIFWTVTPIILSIPYLVSGFVPDFLTAYFESVSALTTTGASTLDPDTMPRSFHIWRSLTQWAGGVIVATFAVVILAALNLKGTGVHKSLLFTFRKGELFQKLAGVSRIIAGIYALISLVVFVAMVMFGTPIFDAICLALTSVSTGGFTPRSGGLNEYVGGLGLFALCLSCFLGACNVAVLWDIIRGLTWRNMFKLVTNVEHRALLSLIVLILVLGGFYTDFHHIRTVAVEAVFFVTSTGYDYHVIGIDMLPPVILIAIALIGGSALSTTGGLKLIRMLLLFRHLETDMDRLTHPSRVVPVMFRSRQLADNAFLSIWMYFFGYTFVFAAGIMALAAAGMEFEMSVTTSSAALSNMGPLLETTMPPYGYAEFTGLQLMVAAVLMLVGRIEVLAAMAVISPRLWKS